MSYRFLHTDTYKQTHISIHAYTSSYNCIPTHAFISYIIHTRKFHAGCAISTGLHSEVNEEGDTCYYCPKHGDVIDVDAPCVTCGSRFGENSMLLCDDCCDSYHMGCLDPPMESVPEVRQRIIYIYMYAYICICMHIYVYICIHMYIYNCICIYNYICVYTNMYINAGSFLLP